MTSTDQLAEIKRRHRRSLLLLPNVTGVGIGPKIANRQPTGGLAIKVYVGQKVPDSMLCESDRIPSSLEGVPTDVEVLGPLRAQPDAGDQSAKGDDE